MMHDDLDDVSGIMDFATAPPRRTPTEGGIRHAAGLHKPPAGAGGPGHCRASSHGTVPDVGFFWYAPNLHELLASCATECRCIRCSRSSKDGTMAPTTSMASPALPVSLTAQAREDSAKLCAVQHVGARFTLADPAPMTLCDSAAAT